jgi:hypothetical protein
MLAGLSAWGRLWQSALLLAGGLLIGLIPLALGNTSGANWTPESARTPLIAFAFGAALVITFIAVSCLMSRERRALGLGMISGVAATILAYASLMSNAAGSY